MIIARNGGIYIDVQLTVVPSPKARKAPDKEAKVIIGSSLVMYSFTGPLLEQVAPARAGLKPGEDFI